MAAVADRRYRWLEQFGYWQVLVETQWYRHETCPAVTCFEIDRPANADRDDRIFGTRHGGDAELQVVATAMGVPAPALAVAASTVMQGNVGDVVEQHENRDHRPSATAVDWRTESLAPRAVEFERWVGVHERLVARRGSVSPARRMA